MREHPHGSRERYEEHPTGCCDGCRLMMILHTKHEPVSVAIPDTRIPAQGYGTVIRAFQREGYSFDDLATVCGLAAGTLKQIAWGITQSIRPETAEAIRRMVQRLPSEAVSA